MMAYKNAVIDEYLLATRKKENLKSFLALRTQSSKTLSLKVASAVDPTGKTSRCALQNRPILLEGEALDFLRRPSLTFRGVVRIRFTLDCVVPTANAMR